MKKKVKNIEIKCVKGVTPFKKGFFYMADNRVFSEQTTGEKSIMVIESTEPYTGDLNCYFVPMDKFLQHFVWLDPEEGIDRPEFLHSDEIQRLISITTEKGLKKIFPDSKLVYSKLATCYYKVKDKHWIRCSYKMKDNKTYATQYSQMHTDNIDFDRFIVEKIYTGDEKENSMTYGIVNLFRK